MGDLKFQQETFSVVAIQPLSYFAVSQQPDIVNTLSLSDSLVSRPVTLLTISNSVVEDIATAVSPVTDKSAFACGHDALPTAVEGN